MMVTRHVALQIQRIKVCNEPIQSGHKKLQNMHKVYRVHQLITNLLLSKMGNSMKFVQKLKSTFTRRNGILAVIATLVAIVAPEMVAAGTSTGTEFTGAYNQILDWAQGGLGKLISLTFLVVGIVMGVMRQSIFAAVPAVACALAMSVGPGVIDGIIGAAL
jgi:conjugal transfer pilus assembly protein TraA